MADREFLTGKPGNALCLDPDFHFGMKGIHLPHCGLKE